MIVMVSNQTGFELGRLATMHEGQLGHLYSPGGERGPWPWMPYALDNGAYPAFTKGLPFDFSAWRNLLNWATFSGQQPLWALAPDVVGDRVGTIDWWRAYSPEIIKRGFRPAFAAQDGMAFDDVPSADCMIFIGGSTAWKDEAIKTWPARFPGRVHVGRVNKPDRLLRCWRAGVVSVDGTGWFHKSGGQRAELEKFLRETRP